jgi:hypothetical protein
MRVTASSGTGLLSDRYRIDTLASAKKPVLQSWASLITTQRLSGTAVGCGVVGGAELKGLGRAGGFVECFERIFQKRLTMLRKQIKISPLCCSRTKRESEQFVGGGESELFEYLERSFRKYLTTKQKAD